jgi:hypothetical protein
MSRLNLVRRNDAPLPPYDCEMVQCDVAFVPFILGALWQRSQRYWWAQAEDQQLGRWAMNKQMLEVLMPCGQDIVRSVDRLYRLVDATFNNRFYGRTGSGTPDDPYIFDPEIPGVPEVGATDDYAWRNNSYAVRALIDNLVTGVPNDKSSDIRNFRQQLEDILAAIGSGSFDPATIEALLAEVVLALG